MGDKTGISWTDATWNPVRGRSRVSEGCRNCYAERVAARFCGEGQPYHGLADRARKGSKWTGDVRLIPEHLADPLRWKKPRRIFVNSMSDLFHEGLTNEQIAAVFGVMAAAPQHTFQILTKRAKRMREWSEWAGRLHMPEVAMMNVALRVLPEGTRLSVHAPTDGSGWPLPSVWLGCSVENQAAADERIPELLKTPAAVRFLSCEPLLSEVVLDAWSRADQKARSGDWLRAFRRGDLTAYGEEILVDRPRIDWVVSGCESGPGARECKVEWLRSLRDQCAAAGVPFFLKQAVEEKDHRESWIVANREGSKRKADGVIELPYLDGVQHAAFPEATNA